jgi:hypothetical protein
MQTVQAQQTQRAHHSRAVASTLPDTVATPCRVSASSEPTTPEPTYRTIHKYKPHVFMYKTYLHTYALRSALYNHLLF